MTEGRTAGVVHLPSRHTAHQPSTSSPHRQLRISSSRCEAIRVTRCQQSICHPREIPRLKSLPPLWARLPHTTCNLLYQLKRVAASGSWGHSKLPGVTMILAVAEERNAARSCHVWKRVPALEWTTEQPWLGMGALVREASEVGLIWHGRKLPFECEIAVFLPPATFGLPKLCCHQAAGHA
jgi:hypothetical protein